MIGVSAGPIPLRTESGFEAHQTLIYGYRSNGAWFPARPDESVRGLRSSALSASENKENSVRCYHKDGAVVGCGLSNDGSIFFTMDGEMVGTPFRNPKGMLFPFVLMGWHGSVIANFGARPFVYQCPQ